VGVFAPHVVQLRIDGVDLARREADGDARREAHRPGRARVGAGELVEAERDGNAVRYRLNLSAAEEAVGFLLGMMQPAGKGERRAAPRPSRRMKPA
jgi:hypothetical protein